MNFLYNWLKKLTNAKKSHRKGLENVVVGKILEIDSHPNADRLQVTKTDIGKEVLQIVCGAPNIKVGQMVPVAPSGAKLGEVEIKEAKIRGVKSFGMICAEDELGLGAGHDGIMVLDSPPHQYDENKINNIDKKSKGIPKILNKLYANWCGGKKAKVGMDFAEYISNK